MPSPDSIAVYTVSRGRVSLATSYKPISLRVDGGQSAALILATLSAFLEYFKKEKA